MSFWLDNLQSKIQDQRIKQEAICHVLFLPVVLNSRSMSVKEKDNHRHAKISSTTSSPTLVRGQCLAILLFRKTYWAEDPLKTPPVVFFGNMNIARIFIRVSIL